ncbi:MAG: hypothetical protein JWN36_1956 [Microbacteriaceae bacterium]|nr:hypothetical protein [Microbacteriaceae bacterium]
MAEKYEGFSADEKAAMKQRARELKDEAKRADGLTLLQEAIEAMDGDDRVAAQRIHEIVTEVAPQLAPKTWYGFPSYAKDDKVVIFFQPGSKFKTRYSTLGFQDTAQLDDGTMWPTSYAITTLSAADEKRIAELVKKAAG